MTGYACRHRVTFAETNLVGNVYFTHYLEWQGVCRESFLFDQVSSVADDVLSGRLALVTVGCAMEYFEECYAGDEVTIEMTPAGVSANRVRMGFRFHTRGIEVARGEQTIACMARQANGLNPVQVPTDLIEAMNRYA